MDTDELFELFQQEHPEEVQYILDNGVPDGHTFLSYLQELCERKYNRSLQETQLKDYNDCLQEDLLIFERQSLKDKLETIEIEWTPEDKRALLLKKYDVEAFEKAERKVEMIVLLTKLRTTTMKNEAYIESAKKVLAYVTHSM